MRAVFSAVVVIVLAVLLTTLSILSFIQPKLELTGNITPSMLDDCVFLGDNLNAGDLSYIVSPGTYKINIYPDDSLTSIKGLWYSTDCSAAIVRGEEKTVSEGHSSIVIKTWWYSLSSWEKKAKPNFSTTIVFNDRDVDKKLELTASMIVHYPSRVGLNEFDENQASVVVGCNVYVVSRDDYKEIKKYLRRQNIVNYRLFEIIGAVFFDFIAIGVFVNYRKILDEV